MSEASKNAIIERCVSVIRNHPNTGGGLGPLKKWLDAILADKDRGKELRGLVKDIAKDNTLADKVCVLVERFSERAGDPWKRNLVRGRRLADGLGHHRAESSHHSEKPYRLSSGIPQSLHAQRRWS